MKPCITPLAERRRRSAKYWGDPERRLAQVNRIRAAKGKHPLSSPNEIGAELKVHAASRLRGERGKFL